MNKMKTVSTERYCLFVYALNSPQRREVAVIFATIFNDFDDDDTNTVTVKSQKRDLQLVFHFISIALISFFPTDFNERNKPPELAGTNIYFKWMDN